MTYELIGIRIFWKFQKDFLTFSVAETVFGLTLLLFSIQR
jgi:hypothetical protein